MYIGETARMLGTRFREHTDGKHSDSAIAEHTSPTGHRYTLDDQDPGEVGKVVPEKDTRSPLDPQKVPCPQPRPRPGNPRYSSTTPVT